MQRLLILLLVVGALLGGYLVSKKTNTPTATSGPQAGAIAVPDTTADTTLGNTAFTQSLPSLAGDATTLNKWQGKNRLVNFWATWCVPCIREIPLLKELQATNDQLQIVGIAIDNAEAVSAYAAEAAFNYPILIGEETGMQIAEALGIDFLALPLTLLIAPDNELIYAHLGEFKPEHVAMITPVVEALAAGTLSSADARAQLTE